MFRRIAYIIEKNLSVKRSFNSQKDITKEELEKYMKQGVKIIDVRSPQEYREGHIDGAILVPDYQLKKQIGKYAKDKDEFIILYCSTGHRSKRCQEILENMGYTNVYNLYEGITI